MSASVISQLRKAFPEFSWAVGRYARTRSHTWLGKLSDNSVIIDISKPGRFICSVMVRVGDQWYRVEPLIEQAEVFRFPEGYCGVADVIAAVKQSGTLSLKLLSLESFTM